MTTAAEPAWQNIPTKIQTVVRRLIEVARPKKASLFGSYVRGDANDVKEVEAQARYCSHRSAGGTHRRPALGLSLQ
jgi:hypothetical protein